MRRRSPVLHHQHGQHAERQRGQDPARVLAQRDAERRTLVVRQREPHDVAEHFMRYVLRLQALGGDLLRGAVREDEERDEGPEDERLVLFILQSRHLLRGLGD